MTKEQIEIVKECLLERVRYDEQVGKETTFYDRLANVGRKDPRVPHTARRGA